MARGDLRPSAAISHRRYNDRIEPKSTALYSGANASLQPSFKLKLLLKIYPLWTIRIFETRKNGVS